MTPTTLQQARENVAARLHQPYQQRAVLEGSWDRGSLVRDEIAKLTEAKGQ